MYKKKHIISLSLSLILAMGTITTPIAAADFSDGTTWEESVSAEENQQEEIFADNNLSDGISGTFVSGNETDTTDTLTDDGIAAESDFASDSSTANCC